MVAKGNKQATDAYRAIIHEHRARFDRVSQRTGPAELKKVYDRAQDELVSKLGRIIKAGRGDSFTAHQHRILIVQTRQAQMLISQKLAAGMGPITQDVQTESLRGLVSDITRLQHKFTGADIVLPIEEASRFQRTIAISRPTLIRMNQKSFAKYGAEVTSSIEESIGQSLAIGETAGQAIERVREAADLEWWKGERIVRTELSYAYNKTHADGVAEVAQEIPDMQQRWTEYCTDSDPAVGLDERVGFDSIAMHGQVARPGQLFIMPPDPRVSESLRGGSWECPPCRPNGREILSPWRPSWGIWGWRWEGRRVAVSA